MTSVGQFTVSSDASLQVAAAQIAASTTTSGDAANTVPQIRQATVISDEGIPVVGEPGICTVTFDGTTNVSGVQYLSGYSPLAGRRVETITMSGSTVILGELYGEIWYIIPLLNGFTNYSGSYAVAAAHYLNKVVQLRGLVNAPSGGGGSNPICVLPPAYSPVSTLMFAVEAYGSPYTRRIDVLSDGTVCCPTGDLPSGQYFSLSGISYRTD
jgi:hypothetical protein